MIREDWKQVIINVLEQHLQPASILVFGSYAKGTVRDDSDLDIAYYSEKSVTNYERFLLAGKLIHFTDENVFIKERMKAYSMYATLNEQRAAILKGIEERGNVYGS